MSKKNTFLWIGLGAKAEKCNFRSTALLITNNWYADCEVDLRWQIHWVGKGLGREAAARHSVCG